MPHPALGADLEAAVERLYEVFADYRLTSYEPCPDCYPAEEVRRIGQRLRTTALRSLALNDVRHFYSDGVLTWGDVEDFRHLLPRLMELFAAVHLGREVPWNQDEIAVRIDLDPDVALLRFVDADWMSWPEPERVAVDSFFLALWSAYLAEGDPSPLPAGVWFDEDLLEAILRLVPSPQPYLDRWRATDWRGSRKLAWFISTDQMTGWLTWDDGERPTTIANWNDVRHWLDDPATEAQLEGAARTAPPDIGWEFVLALEVLGRGRPAVRFRGGGWDPDEQSVARASSLGVDLSRLPRENDAR